MNALMTDQQLITVLRDLRSSILQFDGTLDAVKRSALLQRIEATAQSALSLKARLADGKEEGHASSGRRAGATSRFCHDRSRGVQHQETA